jgi:hypothetical protein
MIIDTIRECVLTWFCLFLIFETLAPEIYRFSFNFAANIMVSSDHKAVSILE